MLALVLYRGHLLPSLHLRPHTYPSSEAASAIGRYATVEGTVAEVSASEKGTVFLDFGSDYPHQDFTAVIPAREASRLVALSSYKGRALDVTGRIDRYQGKPEIVVDSVQQLRLVKSR